MRTGTLEMLCADAVDQFAVMRMHRAKWYSNNQREAYLWANHELRRIERVMGRVVWC